MSNKQRTFKIFKYLWNNTDEEHPVTIKEILEYLEKEEGIKSNRETIADDVLKLQDAGFDIICNRKRQNQYFVGDRTLELSEVKIIIDAIQSAKFISNSKSKMLIDKLSSICGYHHSEELKRNLYVDGKVKTDNEKILYTVDIINNAINRKKTVSFKYIEYTPTKEKKLKHNGQEYIISPYDLVWSTDAYYVMGWSRGNGHDKVVKFTVDRITDICERRIKYHFKPEDYSVANYSKKVFSMYEGVDTTVVLRCKNEVMNEIVDRFGKNVISKPYDANTFLAKTSVSVSPTFFAWVFGFSGKIKIVSPEKVKKEFATQMNKFQ